MNIRIVSIKNFLIIIILCAFFIPSSVLITFVFRHVNESKNDLTNMAHNLTATNINMLISNELSHYAYLLEQNCFNAIRPSTLENSVVLACGHFKNKSVSINYVKDNHVTYISSYSLLKSKHWPLISSNQKNMVLFNYETKVMPPYFRRFIFIKKEIKNRLYFAIIDPIVIESKIDGLRSKILKVTKDIPLVLTENEVVFAPEEFRYASVFDNLTINTDVIELPNDKYILNNKKYIFSDYNIRITFARKQSTIDIGQSRMTLITIYSMLFISLLGFLGIICVNNVLTVPLLKIVEILKLNIEKLSDFGPIISELKSINVEESKLKETIELKNSAINIFDNIQKRDKKLLKLSKELTDNEVLAKLGELATQVAHDIKSPLSALVMTMKDLESLPESTRIIIRSSIQRIQDIANNLSTKKSNQSNKKNDCKKLAPQLLSSCIEEIISEKRMQNRSHLGIDIIGNLDNSYGLFANINLVEFKRALSNVINNAIEALPNMQGIITVHLKEKDERELQIVIEDNGRGIPIEMLSQLGNKGVTFGKEGLRSSGEGLGLFHARTTIETWNGRFAIKSIVGEGTKVHFILPKVKPPHWFVSKLEVAEKSALVVLDDDHGIHQTWDKIFAINDLAKANIQMFHLTNPEDFSNWIQNKSLQFNDIVYLCDFEIIGHKKSGLDLIEEHSIGKSSILVTSHYEEYKIKERCIKSEVKLIPKMIVGDVPIFIKRPQQPHNSINIAAVLLDDDDLIRLTWDIKAEQAGVNLITYSTKTELFNDIDKFHSETTFYIDSYLKDEINGEEVAKILFDKGFLNLILTTGYEKSKFSKLTYLQDIIDKTAPW